MFIHKYTYIGWYPTYSPRLLIHELGRMKILKTTLVLYYNIILRNCPIVCYENRASLVLLDGLK